MAFPQKITDELSRVPTKTPGISSQLLMLSSLIFFLSLASYLGLDFGYKPYLNNQIESLNQDIDSFAKQIPPAEQVEIVNFYSQLANLKILLTNHVFASTFFDWFEKNTQINVYYQNLRFDLVKGDITLSGIGKSIEDISEQLLVLNELPEVKKIILSNVNVTPEKFWQFTLKITIDPKIVTKPNLQEN